MQIVPRDLISSLPRSVALIESCQVSSRRQLIKLTIFCCLFCPLLHPAAALFPFHSFMFPFSSVKINRAYCWQFGDAAAGPDLAGGRPGPQPSLIVGH